VRDHPKKPERRRHRATPGSSLCEVMRHFAPGSEKGVLPCATGGVERSGRSVLDDARQAPSALAARAIAPRSRRRADHVDGAITARAPLCGRLPTTVRRYVGATVKSRKMILVSSLYSFGPDLPSAARRVIVPSPLVFRRPLLLRKAGPSRSP
jgi:hypothetical protein